MAPRKKKAKRATMEGALLLAVLMFVLLFVCSLLLQRHPASAILLPLQSGTTVE